MMRENVPFLYRYFSELEHANYFLAGKIRFSSQKKYRTIEGDRQDGSEGTALFQMQTKIETVSINTQTFEPVDITLEPSRLNYTGRLTNNCFLLCCSGPNVKSPEMTGFGKFIIKVNKPINFLNELNDCIGQVPGAIGAVQLIKVKYDKGDALLDEPSLTNCAILPVSQKPFSYNGEDEFRYVILQDSRVSDKEFVEIDLGSRLDYAELIKI